MHIWYYAHRPYQQASGPEPERPVRPQIIAGLGLLSIRVYPSDGPGFLSPSYGMLGTKGRIFSLSLTSMTGSGTRINVIDWTWNENSGAESLEDRRRSKLQPMYLPFQTAWICRPQ